ncbi:uncharacterized protein LOC124889807 [Capsicum annuum]|uniref:uncharacterized protein LOC124889807 n=1 Tax=Capsicum annuum TaxID=4072 RepID=UPI001FB0A1FD|nr:uncharacterized protein LOC124889807 [Capsicum annuum]
MQSNITVREYSLKFTQLARYAPHVVSDSRSKISKFVFGVNDSVVNECKSAMLNSDMTLARLMTHALQIEKQKIKMREKQNKRVRIGHFNFAQPKSEGENLSQFCSSASSPAPKFRDGNRDRAPSSKSRGSVSNAQTNSPCQTYAKNHKSVCRVGSNVYFECGKPGHRVRDCPQSGYQGQQNRSPAQFGRPNQQDATSNATSGQRPNRFYALQSCQD